MSLFERKYVGFCFLFFFLLDTELSVENGEILLELVSATNILVCNIPAPHRKAREGIEHRVQCCESSNKLTINMQITLQHG